MQPLSQGDQNKPPEPVIQLSPRKWLALRLIIACLFGVVVTLVSLVAGYHVALHSHTISPQLKTQDIIKTRTGQIEQYRTKNHKLPLTLGQFGFLGQYDAFNGPLIYTIQGTHYLIVSYGEDRKPGGTGWNSDISSVNLYPANAQLTFQAFVNDDYTQEAVLTAYVTGVLAALLCLVTVQSRPVTRRSLWGLIVRFVLVLLAATYVGGVMAIMELPIAGPTGGH